MTGSEGQKKQVLFLCTGNYYRSRFAEELFNHLAILRGLDWEATSRGIALERGLHNAGPFSIHARRGLAARGIAPRAADRHPLPLRDDDLAAADRIVAVKEAEHRPLLAERFPGWAGRVEYWHVDDVEDGPPGEAVSEMERHVRELIRRLDSE